jgi:hypothetical protein
LSHFNEFSTDVAVTSGVILSVHARLHNGLKVRQKGSVSTDNQIAGRPNSFQGRDAPQKMK